MTYTPVDFVDGSTPLNAQTFDRLEQGIVDAHAGLPPAPVNGQWLKGSGGALVWSAIAQADVANLTTDLAAKQATAQKGVANGYAGLDASAKVPTTQLPSAALNSGAELGYGQTVGPVSCAGTTEAGASVITAAPSVTLDGVTPIMVEAFIPTIAFSDAPTATVYLFDGSTSLGWVWRLDGSRVATNVFMGHVIRTSTRLIPSAGAHTYSIRGSVSSGVGMVVYAGPGGAGQWQPAFVRVTLASPVIP